MRRRVAALVGPTAVGKSAVAVVVAQRLGAEIVSIDSMQAYRGMDIGTDKATGAARAAVPHHLLDLRPPSHELTVAEFQGLARSAIAAISERGALPLLVGGSGLYFRAVVDDLSFPPRAPAVRSRLEAEAARRGGPERLHAHLGRVDPSAAARIAPANVRRVVRALEVLELTGRPLGDYEPWRRYDSIYELTVAGLARPRDDLSARIEERARRMLAAGLVEEARRLELEGLSATARQALGYRQVLEAPRASPGELEAEIVRATRRFARRQESWFKADPRVVWFDAALPGVEERIAAFLSSATNPREARGGSVKR